MRAICVAVLSLMLASSMEIDRLQQAVNNAMTRRDGAAVALDVETGRILASYRLDVAARRVASPGSTVKPFTLMALLEAGVVDGQTAFVCPITVRIGGRQLDCSHPSTADPFDPILALAHSCNHFFIRSSERLPMDALYRAFSGAGFDSLTGKSETEIRGSLQLPVSKESMQLMSVGESNVAVTPLALAEAYRSLALRLRAPRQSPEELRLILLGLEAAVKVGTARAAASERMQVAGKTGTSGGHAWFAGFAPAGRPEIVVVVFLEHGTGGSDAAPIAGRIFAGYPPLRDGR